MFKGSTKSTTECSIEWRERLEEEHCFTYVGSIISSRGNGVKEVKSRVNELAKVQGGLKVKFTSKSVTMQVKRKLAEGIAIPG